MNGTVRYRQGFLHRSCHTTRKGNKSESHILVELELFLRDYTSRHITPHFAHRPSLEELVGDSVVSILGPSTEGVNNGATAITTAFMLWMPVHK